MKKILISMMLVISVVTASAQRQRVGELGSGNRKALATERDARMTKKQLFDFGWQFTHRSALPLGSSKNLQYSIVLDHQPYNLDRAETAGIDFQLSGHTHRGQVWPISWITDHIYECSWGSHQRGNTQFYISSGLGIWGGKFRIGTQSEYVVATLTSDKSLSD
jgi:predicted MPP superfamily phosphohydrolase